MRKQIVQVSLLQSAKVIAALYLVIAIPIVLVMSLLTSALSQQFSVLTLVLIPLFYAFAGFLGSLLSGWVYNLVAARIGGIEFTTAEVGAAQQG